MSSNCAFCFSIALRMSAIGADFVSLRGLTMFGGMFISLAFTRRDLGIPR